MSNYWRILWSLILASILCTTKTWSGVDITRIRLDPTLPNYRFGVAEHPTNGQQVFGEPLQHYQMLTGDFDGNGVEDVAFYNQVAFARAYFLDRPGNGELTIIGYDDLFSYGAASPCGGAGCKPTCSETGPNARFKSLKSWQIFMDDWVAYDIDGDGAEEIIGVDHDPFYLNQWGQVVNNGAGGITLQVYDYDPNSAKMERTFHSAQTGFWHELSFITSPGGQFGNRYFVDTCSTTANGYWAGRLGIKIANLRGRAFPQDIVIHSNGALGSTHYIALAYDKIGINGQPELRELFRYASTGQDIFTLYRGHDGHAVGVDDLDMDGKDELISRTIVSFDPVANTVIFPSANHTDLFPWGFFLGEWNNPAPAYLYSHVDSVSTGDHLKNFYDNRGFLRPSPGKEVVTTSYQHEAICAGNATTNCSDPAGPTILRATQGPSLDMSGLPESRRWPIKLLNKNDPSDGVEDGKVYMHWSEPPLIVNQPSNSSNWDTLFSRLNNHPFDAQVVIVEDFTDLTPGPEMLFPSKGHIPGTPNCNGGSPHFLFSTTKDLTALGWEDSGASSQEQYGPTIFWNRVTDMFGTRAQKEVVSSGSFGCQGPPVNGSDDEFYQNVWAWEANSQDPEKQVKPILKHSIEWLVYYPPATMTNSIHWSRTTHDMVGDSREELVSLKLDTIAGGNNSELHYQNSFLVLASDNSNTIRDEQSPAKFRDYTTKRLFVDGLRFYTQHLPPGQVGRNYGVAQDRSLSMGQGIAIVAEGGTAPYSFSLVKGELPQGLSLRTIQHQELGHVLFIEGTPQGVSKRRLRFKVTDFNGQSIQKNFWIEVKPGPQGQSGVADSHPRIVGSGISNLALANTNNLLRVSAQIHPGHPDPNNVVIGVFDSNNQIVGRLRHQAGFRFAANLRLNKPAGQHLYKFRAFYSGNEFARDWPYLSIEGGEGINQVLYNPITNPPNNTPEQMPVVEFVEKTVDNIVGAEHRSLPAQLGLAVRVDRKNRPIKRIRVEIRHPDAQDNLYVYNYFPNNPLADNHRLSIGHLLPAGEFGWGQYALTVMAETENSQGEVFQSNEWPHIRFY